MDIKFSYIEEKDADFAIISSIINNKNVENLFLNLIGESGMLLNVYHSLTQQQLNGKVGESDIVLIYKNVNNKKFAIFIEDKTTANPQPNQRKRYNERAELLKKEIDFDKYYIILCAPLKYLYSIKAREYENKISYESIIDLVNDLFVKKIFEFAITEKNIKLLLKRIKAYLVFGLNYMNILM